MEIVEDIQRSRKHLQTLLGQAIPLKFDKYNIWYLWIFHEVGLGTREGGRRQRREKVLTATILPRKAPLSQKGFGIY